MASKFNLKVASVFLAKKMKKNFKIKKTDVKTIKNKKAHEKNKEIKNLTE